MRRKNLEILDDEDDFVPETFYHAYKDIDVDYERSNPCLKEHAT